jgi:3-hydroxy-3-methylglutaryl CoA synthase
MGENQNSTDGNYFEVFFTKLKEQSFTIILLVGIMWYQNGRYQVQVADYKKMIQDKDMLILNMNNDERQRNMERIKYLQEERDKYIEHIIERDER